MAKAMADASEASLPEWKAAGADREESRRLLLGDPDSGTRLKKQGAQAPKNTKRWKPLQIRKDEFELRPTL